MNRSIAVFLVITFVPAWLIAFVLYEWKPAWGERDIFALGSLAAMMCPALGAYVSRRFVEGNRDFGDLGVRAPVKFYAAVLGLTIVQVAIPATIALATKQAKILHSFDARIVIRLLLNLAIPWLFGFGEEFGWRAFLFRRLMPRGPLFAYVVVGIIWNFWNWVPATMHEIQQRTALATPLQAFSLAITGSAFLIPFAICQSIIAGWLYLRTRDVWLVAVWRGYSYGFLNSARVIALGLGETDLLRLAPVLDAFAAIALIVLGNALRLSLTNNRTEAREMAGGTQR